MHARRNRATVFAWLALFLAAALGFPLGWAESAAAQETELAKPARVVLLAEIEGPIGPATTRHVRDAVEHAQARGAETLVLRLNTPGGLATSMRDVIAAILESHVPVVGYVAPSGAHAASAGTYILYATHVAAMAPGTNLGAATPVQIGGPGLPGQPRDSEDPRQRDEGKSGGTEKKSAGNGEATNEKAEGTPQQEEPRDLAPKEPMTAKAVNDAVAFIRSLAELHGRNAEWAEKAVREAASLSAAQALAQNVVDVNAASVETLLTAIDGRTVKVGEQERTLATKDLPVETVEPGFMTKLLGLLSNPNVALILMMIGVYGLIFEFANPGNIGPGVVGAISLVLALYGLNQLPVDFAGLALVVLGIAFMVAEAFTPTFGVLGVGGLVAFVIGASMLIDTDVPAYQISWPVIAGTAVASGLILVLVLGYAWRNHRRPPVAGGSDWLAGREAEVLEWSDGQGFVWAEGDRWRARGEGEFMPGTKVRVLAADGLTLSVEDAPSGSDSEPLDPANRGQDQGA